MGFANVKFVEEPEGKGNPGEQREGTGMAAQNGKAATSSAWHDSGEDMLEPEFCAVYMTRLKEVYERHMAGKRHACEPSSFLEHTQYTPKAMLPLSNLPSRSLIS